MVKDILKFEKREQKELKLHQDATSCFIYGIGFLKKLASKNYWKVRDHCHYTGKFRGATHSICNVRFSVPNKISVVFYNGSNCYYHFIIKEIANEFEKQR